MTREERETKIFDKMERLYGRRRYVREIREFEEYKGFSRRIQERDKERRNLMSKEKEREAKSSRGRIEFRGRQVQKGRFTRNIYGKNFV